MGASKSLKARKAAAAQATKPKRVKAKNKEEYGTKLTKAEKKTKKTISLPKEKERNRQNYILKKQKQVQKSPDEADKTGHEGTTQSNELAGPAKMPIEAEDDENDNVKNSRDGGALKADAPEYESTVEPTRANDDAPARNDVSSCAETKSSTDKKGEKTTETSKKVKKSRSKKKTTTQDTEMLATGDSDSTGKRKREEASDLIKEVEEPVAKKDKKEKERDKKKKRKGEADHVKDVQAEAMVVDEVDVDKTDGDNDSKKGKRGLLKSDAAKKEKKSKTSMAKDKDFQVTEVKELSQLQGDKSEAATKDKKRKSKFKEELADDDTAVELAKPDRTKGDDGAQTRAQDKEQKRERKKREKESKRLKKQREKEAADGQDAMDKWNVGELTGGTARQDKYLRLLGGKKTSSSTTKTTSSKAAKGVSAASMAEAEVQRQFEAGVKMKADGGGKRRGLGA
ncbi:hypothetical protein GQ602_004782 [Ophiocordyceps camponoti-floridani]|uniref:Small acidic protein n=1 Tax=Ophiocordyceps camponoti-floridani TaxID=2030778 RepID=A0A8H4Q4G6_9HYPO|nr:hypothetical protein GQ602_004782 [Ophiocordyceps camponoti-floridani]